MWTTLKCLQIIGKDLSRITCDGIMEIGKLVVVLGIVFMIIIKEIKLYKINIYKKKTRKYMKFYNFFLLTKLEKVQ